MKPPSIPRTGLLTSALLALLLALPAQAARIALVVGNAAYSDGPLKNPVNDARAVQAKLTRLGFEVTQVENLKRRDIGRTINSFASRIRPGDEVVVFYAGHGVQVKGINYLPAVDADIQSEEDVPLNSLNLGNLLERLDEAKAGVKILLLDACRNNPYARSFRSGTRGLARVQDAPSGTLMHFATRPGSVAADGTGSNGLYTTELLRHIDQPGMPIEQMLKRVSAAVDKASKGQQEPWTEGSLRGDFYFQPGSGTQVTSVAPMPTGQPVQRDPEADAWEIAQRANTAAVYNAFLTEFPNGRYASTARIALSNLRANPVAAAPAATQGPQTLIPSPALSRIKSRGSVTLGVREFAVPLSYTLGNGKYTGFHTEMAERIVGDLAKGMDRPLAISYLPITSQNRIPLVQNGTVDLECGATTNNRARGGDAAFAVTTFVSEVRIATRRSSGIRSLQDLNGKRVAVTTGTTSAQLLRRKGISVNEVYGKDHADSFLQVEAGQADAFVMDDTILAGNIARARIPADFHIVGEPLSVEPIGCMMGKDDPALKKAIDDSIKRQVADGSLAALYDKWFMQPIAPIQRSLSMPVSGSTKAAWTSPNDRPVEDY